MLAVMSLTVALSACGSKPAETTEATDSVATAPADSTPVAADTTVVDSAAVAK